MWGNCTPARSRFRRRILRFLVPYAVVLVCSTWLARHEQPGDWEIYIFAAMPALAVVAVMIGIGRYLQEEGDEFQRMVIIRSLLVGTAAMLAIGVVSDFLRSLTPAGALPPFVSFVMFCVGFGIAQLVQTLKNRPGADDDQPSA